MKIPANACILILSLFTGLIAPAQGLLSKTLPPHLNHSLDGEIEELQRIQVQNPNVESEEAHLVKHQGLNKSPSAVIPFKKIQKVTPKTRGGVGDGGHGTRGGAAIACDGRLDPTTKFDLVDRNGRLKQSFVQETMSIFSVYDIKEVQPSEIIQIAPGENPEQYLARLVNEHIRPISPLFARRLEKALHDVRRETWKPKNNLARIQDKGTSFFDKYTRIRSRRCVDVQIVHRNETNPPQLPNSSQVTEIEYDQEYWKLLYDFNEKSVRGSGNFQYAVMILHEALYSMATQLGHNDSARTRSLVRILLEKATYEETFHSFQFLSILNLHGFLDASHFGFEGKKPNQPGTRILLKFAHMLDRFAEFYRDNALRFEGNSGFYKECLESAHLDPQVDCHLISPMRFQKLVLYSYSYSEQEISNHDPEFSFLLYLIGQKYQFDKKGLLEKLIYSISESADEWRNELQESCSDLPQRIRNAHTDVWVVGLYSGYVHSRNDHEIGKMKSTLINAYSYCQSLGFNSR